MIRKSVRTTHQPTAAAKRQLVNPISLEAMLYVLGRAKMFQRLVEIAAQSQWLAQRALARSVEVTQRLGPRVTHLEQQTSRQATTQLQLQSVIPRIRVVRGQGYRLRSSSKQTDSWVTHEHDEWESG